MAFAPIEEIKNRLDIADVVRDYVELHKTGINLRGKCPFHTEKSPSFFVSPSRQSWHCFGGCGEGGDMFSFVMKVEGVEFGDALRLLAKKAGVDLPERAPSFTKFETERKRLLEAAELAACFYERQLEASRRGKEAKEYLRSRGVSEESLRLWRIGYAPDAPRALSDFLIQRGCSSGDIEGAGISARTASGTFDRFRGRIIFPVADLSGQIVGFGGRVFGRLEESNLAKYINSPATPIYDKSRVLYGLDKAKVEIRRQDACVLVEGYMDVIMARQAGTQNIAATSGTALTPQHLRILKRYSSSLLTAFDMDGAGGAATERSIDLAVAEGFSVRVVAMPEGKDPADVAGGDPEGWKKLVEKGLSVFDFFFLRGLGMFDKTTSEGKKAIGEFLLPVIKRIPNRIEQAHWISRLAGELGVREEAIEEEMKKVKEDAGRVRVVSKTPVRGEKLRGRRDILEERMITLCLRLAPLAQERGEWEQELSEDASRLLEIIRLHPDLRFPGVESPVSETTKKRLHDLAMFAESEKDDGRLEEEVRGEFELCVRELEKLAVREHLDEIARQIRNAEEQGEGSKVDELLDKFSLMSRKVTES